MTETVPPLKGTQADIRGDYFQHDAGLFVLDCKPGFGKSTTLNQIAAETLVRADAAGDRCPEQQLCVLSFSREDAASIKPGIRNALEAFAEDTDEQYPVQISFETADRLKRRLQMTDHIGTIDSVLRGIFEDIASELGFDSMPSVGNASQLSLLRQNCMASVRQNEAYSELCTRLETAYPTTADSDGRLQSLLEDARVKKRDRRLSTDDFEARLRETVNDVYPNGPPETFSDLLADIRTFYDDDIATDFAAQQPLGTDEETSEAVKRDQECYTEWLTCIEEFCIVLEGYERAYDAACREQGVVSHADIAYWIAEYFDNPLEDVAGTDKGASEEYRARVKERYAAKFQSLLIDEAQDISIAQHDALAPFVTDRTRVLMAGDVDQCIYVWRNARPEQFVTAFKHGEYFETEWIEYQSYSGSRTYRMRPDIAAAVDTVFGDVFTDPARGGGVKAVSANTDYTSLKPTRTGTADPAVHIAGYTQPEGPPGTPQWFETEVTPLANYLGGGLTDGTFENDTVTVLFASRSNMDELAEQLTEQGFAVVNASTHLFSNPLIKLICRVVWWLVEPYDPERTRSLVESECLPLSSENSRLFENAGYQIDAVAERVDSDRQAATEDGFLAGLVALARRRAQHASDPGSIVAEE
ncbi:UvrD-helicase domain-containing protein, partial [Haloplanus ruber]